MVLYVRLSSFTVLFRFVHLFIIFLSEVTIVGMRVQALGEMTKDLRYR
jgi:hypothetical protein